jgi:hypothetical protein
MGSLLILPTPKTIFLTARFTRFRAFSIALF